MIEEATSSKHSGTTDAPLVSVVAPCFNAEKYLEEALRSIYEQDYPNFEVIIVDDGSTDNSYAMLEQLQKVHGFQLYRQQNQGVSAALNFGLQHARGDYVATPDLDDIMLPHSLSVRAAYLDQHPEVGCVGALVIYIDSEGQETKRQNGNRIRQLDFDYLLGNAYVCGAPVSLYRMEALRAAGFYDPEIKVQDFQMTLRIELNFDVESHQALLFPLRRLSADLAAFLAGRDSGVQRFTLHLEHHGRADSQVTVGLLSAEREATMLFELTRGRLEQLQLPAPVHAVRLEARELPPFTPQHRELFDERPQQYLGWEQLRERLRARLGDEAVQGLSAVAEHRPERSWRPHSCDRAQSPAACGLRPGWLLAEPRPLGEALPTVLAGPERIESGWWDGEDIRRDYYLVETRSGQRAWVYREVGSEGPLWLHGWFA